MVQLLKRFWKWIRQQVMARNTIELINHMANVQYQQSIRLSEMAAALNRIEKKLAAQNEEVDPRLVYSIAEYTKHADALKRAIEAQSEST